MNIDNIKYAINVMKKAKNLDMQNYQGWVASGNIVHNVKDLHACGNTACFIGYMVLTPLWKKFFKEYLKQDYHFSSSGHYCSSESKYTSEATLSLFLGISQKLAESLVYGDTIDKEDDEGWDYEYSNFYEKPWEDVKSEDVITQLELILSGELV